MSRDANEPFRDEDDPEPMRAVHFDLAVTEATGHKDSESLTAAARACLVDDEGRELLSIAAAAEKFGVDRASLNRRVIKIRKKLAEIMAREGLELATVALTPEVKALLYAVEAKNFEPLVARQTEKSRRRAARAVTDTRRRENARHSTKK